jgi:cardiolipin synthase
MAQRRPLVHEESMQEDAPPEGRDRPFRVDYETGGNRLHVRGDGPGLLELLIELIDGAQTSLELFYYMFLSDGSGRRVLAHLIRAARRGVAVTLMVDRFGSMEVNRGFFDSLVRAGGRIGWFGASCSTRFLIRNHQKMAIADGRRALIGGFNVGDAYFGTPQDNCWHDMGLMIEGPEVETLARWYRLLWQWVSSTRQSFRLLRAMVMAWHDGRGVYRWLVGGPTYRLSPWARTVRADLETANHVDLIAAYFTPGNSMLARLKRVARRGMVRLVLASKSDSGTTIAAARLLYGPLLRAGTEIYEYQPCRLHMKLLVIDDAVYIGSANFDMRSLFLNLEIMLRIEDAAFADMIRRFVDERVDDSERITKEVHRARRTPFRLLKGWLSYFLVGVLDYKVTRRLNFPR